MGNCSCKKYMECKWMIGSETRREYRGSIGDRISEWVKNQTKMSL